MMNWMMNLGLIKENNMNNERTDQVKTTWIMTNPIGNEKNSVSWVNQQTQGLDLNIE
jgi:hypothetical protein